MLMFFSVVEIHEGVVFCLAGGEGQPDPGTQDQWSTFDHPIGTELKSDVPETAEIFVAVV